MSYVDLNPIRAGIAENLESSALTSAVRRVAAIKSNAGTAKQSLNSINASPSPDFLPIPAADDVDLIDWTARLTPADKRGSIESTEPPILRKLALNERHWHQQMLGTEKDYWRAIATAQSLIEKATAIGQAWLKGIGSAQSLVRRQAA